jgi:hypothetical protein
MRGTYFALRAVDEMVAHILIEKLDADYAECGVRERESAPCANVAWTGILISRANGGRRGRGVSLGFATLFAAHWQSAVQHEPAETPCACRSNRTLNPTPTRVRHAAFKVAQHNHQKLCQMCKACMVTGADTAARAEKKLYGQRS